MDQSHRVLGQWPRFYWGVGEVGLSVMMGLPKVLVRKFIIVIILFNSNTSGLPTRSW